MTNEEVLLTKILRISHQQVMAGKSYSQEEAEQYLDEDCMSLETRWSEPALLSLAEVLEKSRLSTQ